MKPRVHPSDDLFALADLQEGALTCTQAAAAGLGRHSVDRLVRDGSWQRVVPGLVIVGSSAPDWPALAWGGVLLGGPDARLGGLAAAYLHGLTERPPARILVLVPRQVRRQDRPPWVFRREGAGVRSPRSPGSPPRITVEDTVLDLCDAGPDLTGHAPVHWVTVAVQRRRTTAQRLHRALQRRSRCRERRLLEDMLTDVDAGSQSVLEMRYLRDVERAHGLPRGERQSVRPAARIERRSRASATCSTGRTGWSWSSTACWATSAPGDYMTCAATTSPPCVASRRCATAGTTSSRSRASLRDR